MKYKVKLIYIFYFFCLLCTAPAPSADAAARNDALPDAVTPIRDHYLFNLSKFSLLLFLKEGWDAQEYVTRHTLSWIYSTYTYSRFYSLCTHMYDLFIFLLFPSTLFPHLSLTIILSWKTAVRWRSFFTLTRRLFIFLSCL